MRPVTATETVSYSLVIAAGLALAAAALFFALKELVWEPREYTVFNLALERCRGDPRVQVRLGAPLTGYGVESGSRAARQRIRHKVERDSAGVEHVLVQFQLRGPRGVATVFADGVTDSSAPGGYRMAVIRVADANGALRTIAVEPAAPPPAPMVVSAPAPAAVYDGATGQFAFSGEGERREKPAAKKTPTLWGSLTGRG